MAKTSFLLLLGSLATAATTDVPPVEPAGMLISDSSLAGERRADDVVPRHACCVQASQRRWVVVQRTDRQLYFGIAAADDDEIASTRRVRLDRCRPIHSQHTDAAVLATVGPSERGVAGAEVPSALILEVAIVYDCTKLAVRTFESRK